MHEISCEIKCKPSTSCKRQEELPEAFGVFYDGQKNAPCLDFTLHHENFYTGNKWSHAFVSIFSICCNYSKLVYPLEKNALSLY